MTTRRSFLQILGLAPIAAPLAVKSATEKAVADLAGISLTQTQYGQPSTGTIGGVPIETNNATWKMKVLRFLASKNLPDWVEEEIRNRNRFVGYIDHDIAAKRSWSLAVKILTQRERNIERARNELRESPRRGLRLREFEETYGVWI
jgi:hypothetical protein